MAKRSGRRNRGYYFRQGTGWVCNQGRRYVPLTTEKGERLRDRATPDSVLKAAYARHLLSVKVATIEASSVTVEAVVGAYLEYAKSNGALDTYERRFDTLFDFMYGFPPKFRKHGRKPSAADRIHPGFARKLATEITKLDLDRWLQAHPTWGGGRKSRVQAVKRAFNYALERQMIPTNPLRGYKTPKSRARVTYITDEQEAALMKHAQAKMALAIRVLIRTGARPGIEFAALEARHVRDQQTRMEWVFPAEETKTRKRPRIIRITDLAIMQIVRQQIARYSEGKLFRNAAHRPWAVKTMSKNFRRLIKRAEARGTRFDPDTCLYSTRHTYAKRTLQGYWSGKATNVETLARLMGNSPQVCRDYYLQWCDSYSEPLWDAC